MSAGSSGSPARAGERLRGRHHRRAASDGGRGAPAATRGAKVALWFPDSLVNLGRQLVLLAPYDALSSRTPTWCAAAGHARPPGVLPAGGVLRAQFPVAGYAPAPTGTWSSPGTCTRAGSGYWSGCWPRAHPAPALRPGLPALGGTDPGCAPCTPGGASSRWRRPRSSGPPWRCLNNLHPGEIEGVNARLFEAAGAGAAILTEYRPALPDLFAVGEEVLAFGDFDELVSEATRLAARRRLSAKLGDAAGAARPGGPYLRKKRLDRTAGESVLIAPAPVPPGTYRTGS